MTRLRVTLEVSARSLHQWKKLFRKEWMWMGNVVMGEDRFPVNSYRHLSRAHLLTMLHQVNGSQQIRSQDQCAIKRSSIQRNKKEQSHKIQMILREANIKTNCYVSFEKKVIRDLVALYKTKFQE